jgi:hypothetical protein
MMLSMSMLHSFGYLAPLGLKRLDVKSAFACVRQLRTKLTQAAGAAIRRQLPGRSQPRKELLLREQLSRAIGRAAEPQILFPAIGVLLLTVIWATTIWIIRVKHSDAEHAAAGSSRELLDTYEAQVVRALREVDGAMNLVKYWRERQGTHLALSDLKNNVLLPPDLFFTVSIADARGNIVGARQVMRSYTSAAGWR